MPLDSNLFSDLETAVAWNVAATRTLPRDDPTRFCLATPSSCFDAVCRTWEYAPTSERIVQDIERVFIAIDDVVEAGGITVDFAELRHGRRLQAHKNEQQREKCNIALDNVRGLHPIAKRNISTLIDLTID